MSWITASLIMFTSSVIMYLAVRKASLLKIPTQFNSLAMFLIPLPFYVIFGLATQENFLLTKTQAAIIFLASVLFSFFGNAFSLRSIEYAPNPGYSLVLSKSYVVFTTLVAVLLFQSPISFEKALAILLIILFSAVISIDPKPRERKPNSLWLPFAFGAFFCWGLLSLASKYLFEQGLGVNVFLAYISAIVSVCVLIELKLKKISLKLPSQNLWALLVIGAASTLFNLFLFKAIKIAPN